MKGLPQAHIVAVASTITAGDPIHVEESEGCTDNEISATDKLPLTRGDESRDAAATIEEEKPLVSNTIHHKFTPSCTDKTLLNHKLSPLPTQQLFDTTNNTTTQTLNLARETTRHSAMTKLSMTKNSPPDGAAQTLSTKDAAMASQDLQVPSHAIKSSSAIEVGEHAIAAISHPSIACNDEKEFTTMVLNVSKISSTVMEPNS